MTAPDYREIVNALQCGNPRCVCHHDTTEELLVHCPSHDDVHPSLSLTSHDGKILFHCNAGCEQNAVMAALRAKGLWRVESASVKIETLQRSPLSGVTLAMLADAKKLPIESLRTFSLSDCKYQGANAVRIPYADLEGNLAAIRYRVGISKESIRFKWRRGDHPILYGLDRISEIRRAGWVLLVEGESDCWTAWYQHLPALGILGKSTWRDEWAKYFTGIEVLLWQEPDAEDLAINIAKSLPDLRVVVAPDGIKDLSEAHLQAQDVIGLIEKLKANATRMDVVRKGQTDQRIAELMQQAEPILQADDPLELVQKEIQRMGYGGEIKPAIITYLAATSRLIAVRAGSMLVHLLLLGDSSGGKSWTVKVVSRLLPAEAYHIINAGSARALIYDQADLRHRMVIFGEADSLPSGEDNPAASAIRNLLQDNQLKYQVVVRDPETGDFCVRDVEKPGPTVLVTTAVRRLGNQLMTRLFSLEITDERTQVLARLEKQAAVEEEGLPDPDPALVAFQGYLQAKAPWDVHIPFARKLANEIGKSDLAPRILRDFARLLSLIKTVAIIRHRHRRLDAEGRIVAEIADYSTVRDLVNDMYADTVSGVSKGIREAVVTVSCLQSEMKTDKITVSLVAERLGINKSSASRRIKAAISGGWLVNAETRKGFPAALAVGEPLPIREGLPMPDSLDDCCSVSHRTDQQDVNMKNDRGAVDL